MDAAAHTSPILSSALLPELTALFEQSGLSSHQARLTFKAIHRLGITHPDIMPEISAPCRRFLATLPPIPKVSIAEAVHAQDGTIKLRIKLPRGESVEAVIIPAARRMTLCVSSQVGCAAACSFCHTGTMGLLRNLDAWEILDQVRVAQQYLNQHSGGKRLTNVVFMGMGEPLHNEENVLRACRVLTEGIGLGLSRRHIVMSTAGVGNRIAPFWEQDAASLSLSLHATTDDVRSQLVPLNRTWNLTALKEIFKRIPWRPRETITIAYLLLDGVNDSKEDAQRLAQWIEGLPVKVNLLEFNPFPGSGFKRSSPERLAEFRQWLYELGVFNTLRHSRGDDVMAACGQLATSERSKARRKSM
jgi:23S rRNA (adenine2503-C2)-methyltransferase